MDEEIKKIYEEEIIDQWIEIDQTKYQADKRYQKLNALMEPVYDFVLSYSNYYNQRRSYGKGPKLTMIEVHILTEISDAKGLTVTELAQKRKRTTSAISQTVKKLMEFDLVYRQNSKTNRKIFHLYPTKLGEEISLYHKKYDNIDIVKTNKKLLEKVSADDLIAFNKVCELYNQLLEKPKNKKSGL